MLTKNFYNSLAVMLTGETITNGLRQVTGAISDCAQPTNSNYRGGAYSALGFNSPSFATAATTNGIVFGDGANTPTEDDFCLSGSWISGLSATITRSGSTDENGAFETLLITVTNTNDTDVTVCEVGWQASGYINTTGTAKTCLFDRTVLDTPVTIPAGGIGQVTYTIRMNYPTA